MVEQELCSFDSASIADVAYTREELGSSKCGESGSKHTFTMKDMKGYVSGQSSWKWNVVEGKESHCSPSAKLDKTLIFESRFESGNLGMAMKVSDAEYELAMQNDSLTKGHTQCYFLPVNVRVLFQGYEH